MRHGTPLRSLTLAVGLSAVALMLGCDEVPTDVLADASGPTFHHADGHGGGPGGGGGGPGGGGGGGGDDGGASGTEASFAGGLSAGEQAVDVKRDNKRSLETNPTSYTVTFALVNTKAAAESGACTFNDVATAAGIEQALIDALMTEAGRTVAMDFEIDKDAALDGTASNDNFFRFDGGSLEPEPTVFIGRSGGPFLVVDFDKGTSTGGIDDASATRVFTAPESNTGLVRVVQRVDEDGDGLDGGDPLADLICTLQDEFTLTVAPAP